MRPVQALGLAGRRGGRKCRWLEFTKPLLWAALGQAFYASRPCLSRGLRVSPRLFCGLQGNAAGAVLAVDAKPMGQCLQGIKKPASRWAMLVGIKRKQARAWADACCWMGDYLITSAACFTRASGRVAPCFLAASRFTASESFLPVSGVIVPGAVPLRILSTILPAWRPMS